MACPSLLQPQPSTSVLSLILISISLSRSLLSHVHVSTTCVIFVAFGHFLTSTQLTLLAHYLYTPCLTTAPQCTMVLPKPSYAPSAHPEFATQQMLIYRPHVLLLYYLANFRAVVEAPRSSKPDQIFRSWH